MSQILVASEEERFELIADCVSADPGRALKLALGLAGSGSSAERALAADLMGQAAAADEALASRVSEASAALLDDVDPHVVAAAVTAIGHAGSDRLDPRLVELADSPHAPIRQAIAFALPAMPFDDVVLSTLLKLTRDPEPVIRDWATFALAESDSDEPRTRAALWERVADEDRDTRAEAIFGLARRGESGIEPLIDEELGRGDASALIERAHDQFGGPSNARFVSPGIGRFEIFCGDDGRWRWRYVAGNGRLIATSDASFASRASAKRSIGAFRRGVVAPRTVSA